MIITQVTRTTIYKDGAEFKGVIPNIRIVGQHPKFQLLLRGVFQESYNLYNGQFDKGVFTEGTIQRATGEEFTGKIKDGIWTGEVKKDNILHKGNFQECDSNPSLINDKAEITSITDTRTSQRVDKTMDISQLQYDQLQIGLQYQMFDPAEIFLKKNHEERKTPDGSPRGGFAKH